MNMIVGSNYSNVKRYTIKSADGTVTGSFSVRMPTTKKPKKLKYNFKQISNQIMTAKTSVNAKQVVNRARWQLVSLQKNQRNSDYDSQEVAIAIMHAKRIELVARKKVRHLEQEEQIERNGKSRTLDPEAEEKIDEMMMDALDEEDLLSQDEDQAKEFMDSLEDTLESLEDALESTEATMQRAKKELAELKAERRAAENRASESSLYENTAYENVTPEAVAAEKVFENQARQAEADEKLSDFVRKNIEVMDYERLKRKHRSEELRDIMEADMKYLRAVFDKLEQEKQSASSPGSSSGVSLNIGGTDIPVAAAEAPAPVEGGAIDVTV